MSAWLAAALLAWAGPGDLGRKDVVAVRTTHPPRIDGRLDDPAWAAAPAETRFTQWFPAEGQSPAQVTELRVLYDDRALYVGVRLHDSEPDKIVARLTRRDRIPEADAVVVRIDSRHDHSTAFVFRLHASGVQFDNFFFDDGNGASPEWDAVWAGEVSIDEGGWSAEYRIPLAALRFAGLPEETWGLQVVRYVSRTGETDVLGYWPSTWRGEVSHYDHLVGLRDLRARRTLELRPYLLARVRGGTPDGASFLGGTHGGERGSAGDAGMDLKLGLTSALTLDLSLNPDFGQVEADQVVLNLSRFESFFPEKRPFFLEGTDLLRTPFQLFYSRRIGRPPTALAAGGTVVVDGDTLIVGEAPSALRLWGAGKLTGKVGRDLSLVALSAVTGPEVVTTAADARPLRLAPPRSYDVLRGRYALGGPSYVGVMATGVTRLGGHLYRAADDHDGYAQSLDSQWQSPAAEWRVGSQVLTTERVGGWSRATADGLPCAAPGPGCLPLARNDGTRVTAGQLGAGAGLTVSHIGPHFIEEGSVAVLSPTVDPNDAGFLPQFNKQEATALVAYQERRPGRLFQSFKLGANQALSRDFSGTPIGATSALEWESQLRNFWSVFADVIHDWAGTWDTRETLDGGRFERLSRLEAHLFVATDGRRPVTAELGLSQSHFFGDATVSRRVDAGLNARLSQLEVGLSAALSWDGAALRFYSCQNDGGSPCTVETAARHYLFAALDSGSLSFTSRITYAFSPRLSLQSYAQLFMAQGTYTRYRAVETSGARPFIRRRDLAPTIFTGDGNHDGIKDDDFEQVALNGNLVLRWEPWPGSALYAVYTRAQQASPPLAGLPPAFRAGGLTRGPTEDVLAVKLVYYWAP